MKIEIVTDTFVPDVNGVAMTLGRLSDGLRRLGHQVHVIHTGHCANQNETCVAAVPLPGYHQVRIGLPKPFSLRARWLKDRPDAIYVATESPLGASALKAAKGLGIPAASGFHTNFHQYMESYGIGFLRPIALAYLKTFHQRADCTLTPSQNMVDSLSTAGFQQVHLLGRGVDTDLFAPKKRCHSLRASWGAGEATPVAIIVGRVASEKNFELAIKTFKTMRLVTPDVRCVVVGDGPLRHTLSQKFPWIHFAGIQRGEALAKHYASADVLIFPSETETFGNVLLEAMASGLVTVSYDYAASALHVRSGENGLKASQGDADTFIRHALAALSLRPCDTLRNAARQAAQCVGWELVVEAFVCRLAEISHTNQPIPVAFQPSTSKRQKPSWQTALISDVR